MSDKSRQEIITFKVPESLKESLKGIPNRSQFIRNAVLTALNGACPLCRGTGTLTSDQIAHWERFAEHHSVEECGTCHATILVCGHLSVGLPRDRCAD